MNYFFDTHAHLLDPRLSDLQEKNIREINKVICVYSPDESLDDFFSLLKKDKVYGASGIHPHYASDAHAMWEQMLAAFDNEKVVAVGETGLDFHYMNSPEEIQVEVFKKQLKLSREKGLPVIIHSREAANKTLEILDEVKTYRVLIHCFSGGEKEIKEYLSRGFYIGLGGVLTFAKADELRGAVKDAPLEKLLLETDCPYLSPVPLRGKTNRPANVKYVAEKIAELKDIPVEKVARATYENAIRFFNIK
ncbi:MAG: TatD family hydrolase [Elusimicrobiota bacterium]